jgi:lipopolysaccharide cholinephosphotransferase
MEPTKEQIEKLKIIELEIFKQFVSVCEKLNLKYYLIGGTLLGAVRHQGFIPWDDDIDVAMMREDYEVFIREAQKYLPEEYFVQTNQTDDEFPFNFCKIRRSDTTFWESSVKNLKINQGVFIDIFPIDYHPDGKLSRKIFNLKNMLLNIRISEIFTIEKQKLAVWKKCIVKLTTPNSVRKAVQKRDRLLKSNKGKKLVSNYCGAWGDKEIVPVEWFGEGVELEFEGIKACAPEGYHLWLTQVYGDYMQLPPEEKRVGHHYTEVIDLEKSYRDYMK